MPQLSDNESAIQSTVAKSTTNFSLCIPGALGTCTVLLRSFTEMLKLQGTQGAKKGRRHYALQQGTLGWFVVLKKSHIDVW